MLSVGRRLNLVEDHHLLHKVLLVILNVARGHVQHVEKVLLHQEVQLLLVALNLFADHLIVVSLILGRLGK